MERFSTVLFDLDGTLLPMDQTKFTEFYFCEMARHAEPYGFEKKPLLKAIGASVEAMVRNDGTMTNEERFWSTFQAISGRGEPEEKAILLSFYDTKFEAVKQVCGYNGEAPRLIEDLKKRGYDLILATNPLFPRKATLARIRWAGLDPLDFGLITTYEDSSFCKPNPLYFKELLDRLLLDPKDCVLIGNDAKEDVAAETVGIRTFLLTDCLENGKEEELTVAHGGFKALREWLNLAEPAD